MQCFFLGTSNVTLLLSMLQSAPPGKSKPVDSKDSAVKKEPFRKMVFSYDCSESSFTIQLQFASVCC